MRNARFAMTVTVAAVWVCALAGTSRAQTTTWNNTNPDWTVAGNWDNGVPTATGVAQFNVLGTFGATTLHNPVLNTPATVGQLSMAGNAAFLGSGFPQATGWTLTGTGTLTAGTATANGLYARGSGTHTINLGDGTATSLTLTGPTGTTGGNMNIGSSSTVVLTGNTLAATTGTALSAIRSGTLVLDNSAGNPTSGQRLTTATAVNLNGGGSTIEYRGAAAGSTFNGTTGALGSAGSGDTYLRTVQNGSGALAVSFASMSRVNTSGNHFFENIGSGFVGDVGKPTVTFTTAPTTRQGVISTSAATTIPWAVVTSRSSATSNDVVGRWANYSGGVVASTPTTFTGDFNTATTGTNVLFTGPAVPFQSVNLSTSPTNQLAAVVFEPQADGTTLNIGAGQINTLGVMLSGTRDMFVTGGSLFSTSTSGTRALAVVNPTTALIATSNLGASNNPVTISGPGFVILNGTSNQIGFGSAQNVNLAGGTVRGTTTNFNPTNATIRFRGGVLEYDVSAASTTFNLALGTGANQVNWTSNAGAAAATNVGGGGFSAYSDTPGNTLGVNIGGAAAPLTWNDAAQLFVTDGYALKFGSTRSNATVNFQNPINLDGGAAGNYLVREINVTQGVGNAADKTQLSSAITGSTTTDLLKTGTGVLELAVTNTYRGNTLVRGGTLLLTGSLGDAGTRTGNVVVGSGAVLAGVRSGIVGGTVFSDTAAGKTVYIQTGGVVAPGTTSGTTAAIGFLNGITLSGGAIYAADVNGAAETGYDQLTVLDGAINLGGATLLVGRGTGFTPTSSDRFVIVRNEGTTPVNGTFGGLIQDGTGLTNDGQYNFQISYFGSTDGSSLTSGNSIVLYNFTPVPEPAAVFGVAAAALGVGGFVRRKLRNPA